MSDFAAAKRSLSLLLDDDPLVRGERALGSLDAAVRFRESGGLDAIRTLERRASGSRSRRARRVLAAFERFRTAARGGTRHDESQFRPGRDTPLGEAGQPRRDDEGDPHR